MNFKLPSIHALVNQNKKANAENPTKYIHVRNGYAIVNNDIIAVVNLREYVKTECNIEDEDSIDELDLLLEWFEGKSFTQEFWKNLTTEKLVSLSEDSLKIQDSTFESYLHYDSAQLELALHFKGVSDNIYKSEGSVYRTSFLGSHIDLLNKAFKNELKNDAINFEFSASPGPAKFSLSRRTFIFGSLPTTRHAETSLIAFSENLDFKTSLDEIISTMPVPAPPAPPEDSEQEDEEESDIDSWLPKEDENQELF